MICDHCRASNQVGALFCSQCGLAFSQKSPGGTGGAALHGERRQITVLFCDIVESTKLAAMLDPEEYQDIIRAFARCCTDVVASFEGHVSEMRGDGALVIFGYPTSRGDEAERAIRAALTIIAAVPRLVLPNNVRLQVRVGIATGLAAIDASSSKEPAFAGDALNLAARLQSLAEPSTVVISSLAKRLAGGFFDLVDLGEHDLKGFTNPVAAWRITGVKSVASRFEALRPELTGFVGRQTELQQIEALWEKAKHGNGQIVEILGEAGIGKSRLINQAQHACCEQSQVAKYSCSPYHTGTALHPAIEQLLRMMKFRPEQSPAGRLLQLRKMLAQAGDDFESHLGWIAALLSLPNDTTATVTPPEARQRTLEALLWWLTAVSKKRPLLIVVEDAHWIDPTSLQLAQLIVNQLGTMSALMIVSYRTPYTSPWMDRPQLLSIALDRLDRTKANAIVADLVGERRLPPALVDQIIEKANGVPLFVEELTKMVLGSDAGQEHPSHERMASSRTQLPLTLQDSLTARLDQLAPAKRVAQIASVIGREFTYEVLSEVSGVEAATLEPSLGQLVEAGLIHGVGSEGQERFEFKHALVRDAAYESLLRRDRRDLHAAVASAFERKNAKGSPLEPELLAHHYTEAGAMGDALKYWGIAARRSLQMSANEEALAHAARGLELLDALPDTFDRRRLELELRVVSGWAYWAVKGFSADEVEQTFARAQELAIGIGDDAMLNYALRGMFVCRYTRGELRSAYKLAEQEIALAHKRNDIGDLMLGQWALGSALFWMGEFVPARQQMEASLAIYDPALIQAKIFSSQVAPTISNNMNLCWTLWILGFPDKALERGNEALRDARSNGHALSLSLALFWNGVVRMYRGDLDTARANARELLTITARYHIAYFAVCGILLDGAIMVAAGDAKSGIQRILQALAELRNMRGGLGVPWVMALAADGYLRSGALKEALGALTMGLAATQVEGERHWEAELHRIKGETLLASDADSNQTEASFRQTIDVAKRQGALSLELRAAMPLARLLASRGERVRARECVAGVYSRFTEGFDTADLVAARFLIDELDDASTTIGIAKRAGA
jgi:class 3 adenylate cyclase/tetratricopeptide (TPR) repeat protein